MVKHSSVTDLGVGELKPQKLGKIYILYIN
jgi:hypothetical protein